jgi:hypothetical protein
MNNQPTNKQTNNRRRYDHERSFNLDYNTDNRDLTTTELHSEDAVMGRITMTVDPWELVQNALVNAGFAGGIMTEIRNYFTNAFDHEGSTELDGYDAVGRLNTAQRLADLGYYLLFMSSASGTSEEEFVRVRIEEVTK